MNPMHCKPTQGNGDHKLKQSHSQDTKGKVADKEHAPRIKSE